ncbi:MAG: asparaginase [Planctomycetes bacterium]|nr:asparaginase [Planctomycetota bacterium]
MDQNVCIAHAIRAGMVDNIHRGSMVITDTKGDVLAAVGDPMKRAFIRSAGKPLQAIAFIERDGAETYGLTPPEIAIICASHSGGPEQVETVRSILKKAEVPENALQSGSGIKDNCSGKHSGMLALAKMLGHPLENYRAPDHPIQQIIRETVSEMCGLAADEITVAVDGCGAPIFGMPLKNMAVGYARLANPSDLPWPRAEACVKITASMLAHPEMVGGPDWSALAGDKIVAKSGASGCYCAGVLGKKAGFAMKIDDGSAAASLPACFEMLKRQGYVTEEEHQRFLEKYPMTVRNRAGELVGELKLVF